MAAYFLLGAVAVWSPVMAVGAAAFIGTLIVMGAKEG
jgi:hypothetical protein